MLFARKLVVIALSLVIVDYALTIYGLRTFPESALNPYRAYLCEVNPFGAFFLSPVGIAIMISGICLFYWLAGDKTVMTKKFSVFLKILVLIGIAAGIVVIGNNIFVFKQIIDMGAR